MPAKIPYELLATVSARIYALGLSSFHASGVAAGLGIVDVQVVDGVVAEHLLDRGLDYAAILKEPANAFSVRGVVDRLGSDGLLNAAHAEMAKIVVQHPTQ